MNKVTDDFPQVVRDIFQGITPIRFDANMGEPWDLQEVMSEHECPWLYSIHWEDILDMNKLEEPAQGWDGMAAEYVIKVDWIDRMNGWDALLRQWTE